MFKGLDMGTMKDLLEKTEKIQKEMRKNIDAKKKEAAEKTVDVSVGGGMAQITMNGNLEALSVKIDPEVVNKDEIQILEDLLRAAINEAIRKSKELLPDQLGDMMSGFDISDIANFVK